MMGSLKYASKNLIEYNIIKSNPYILSHVRAFSLCSPLYFFKLKGHKILHVSNPKGRYLKKATRQVTFKEAVKNIVPQFKNDYTKLVKEIKSRFLDDPLIILPGDTHKIFDFKTEEDLKKWHVTCDSDFDEGFSKASFTLSPAGHGVFSGVTDTRIIQTGDLTDSGFANLTSNEVLKSFGRRVNYDWVLYTHLVLRVRGDGRKYLIVLNTGGFYDITWYDTYSYVLYTRGGPYWQEVKIPFSKFILVVKGCVQDHQKHVSLDMVNRIGFTAAQRIDGPFRLEIDYISLHSDPSHKEVFAYETYKVPALTVT